MRAQGGGEGSVGLGHRQDTRSDQPVQDVALAQTPRGQVVQGVVLRESLGHLGEDPVVLRVVKVLGELLLQCGGAGVVAAGQVASPNRTTLTESIPGVWEKRLSSVATIAGPTRSGVGSAARSAP